MGGTAFDPQDRAFFEAAKRRVRQTYDFGFAQNDLQRRTGKMYYGWRKGDLARQYAEKRQLQPWAYGARGLLNSGIRHEALRDLRESRGRDLSRAAKGWGLESQGYSLASNQLWRARQAALKDLEEQQIARRQAIAASLNGFA